MSVDHFEILREIGEALNSSLEPTDVFRIVLERCIKFTRSDTGSIISVNKETRTLDIEHQVGLGAGAEEHVKLKIGEGVTGTAAKEKKPLLVNDVSRSPVYVSVNPQIKAEIAVPILFKSKLLGVISVDSKRINNYRKEDLELLSIVASQVGQVLSNLEIFQELRLRVEHDEWLMEISRILSSSLDMSKPLEEVLHLLKRTEHFDKGALILFDEAEGRLEMKTSFGYSKAQAAKAIYSVDEGVVGKVYRTGKPEAIRDLRSHPLFLDRTETRRQDERPLSFFCIPLLSGGATIGILIFDHVYRGGKIFQQVFDFLNKLETQISKSLQIHVLAQKETARLQSENATLKDLVSERTRFGNLIGRSERMQRVYGQLQAVAASDSTVLLTGESGTGKELVATAIHYNSKRKERAFIAINCAAIPENLLESELFGFKKGSFTGAANDKPGKFRLADGGTIFLDEIGEMPVALQSKLLRVLQEGVVDPVGGSRPEPVDVRVIAATNKNLLQEIRQKNFREDLYYRLSIIPIHLPPLRERREDIPLLVEHFLGVFRAKLEKPSLRVTEDALRQLISHPWEGNIRELRNVLERSAIFTPGELVDRIFFDERVGEPLPLSQAPVIEVRSEPLGLEELLRRRMQEALSESGGYDLDRVHDLVDRMVIEASLRRHKGVHQQAAKSLGISRETLRKRVRELGIDIYGE